MNFTITLIFRKVFVFYSKLVSQIMHAWIPHNIKFHIVNANTYCEIEEQKSTPYRHILYLNIDVEDVNDGSPHAQESEDERDEEKPVV